MPWCGAGVTTTPLLRPVKKPMNNEQVLASQIHQKGELMEDGFELPVTYKGKDLLFPAQLVSFGWTHRIEVAMDGTRVCFERDEEGEWRALLSAEDLKCNKTIDVELVKAIATTIENILK